MIRITLYKNCILSHDYNEVFHHSFFSDYLDTLDKKVIGEIEQVYYENNGTLVFEYELGNNENIYEFNYMRIDVYFDEDEHHFPNYKFTRYCFINDIRIKNEFCYLDYEEDIWQSYSSSLKIRDSYLSRSKLLNYYNNNISIYDIPIKYDSKKALENISLINNRAYYIILKFQIYNTQLFGESSKRRSFTTLLYNMTSTYNNGEITNIQGSSTFSIESAIQYLELLIDKKAYPLKKLFGTTTLDNPYFEIDNVTLVPKEFFEQSNLLNYFPSEFTESMNNNSLSSYFKVGYSLDLNLTATATGFYNDIGIFTLTNENFERISRGKIKGKTYSINNNFKIYSIGSMTNQFVTINNGLNREIDIYYIFNKFNFDIYLEFDNQSIAITNDFVIEIPYDSLNGEVIAQRKLTRTVSNIKSVSHIVSDFVDLGATKIGTENALEMQDLHKTKTMRSKKSKIAEIMKSKLRLDLLNKEVDTGFGVFNGIIDLIETNAPVYSTTNGTFEYTDGIVNAYYGIVIKRINSQNDSYVNKMIEETGYITYQIGGNEFLENYYSSSDVNPIFNNVLQFDFVKAYGDFPQSVCDKLKTILLNGFKIWYH